MWDLLFIDMPTLHFILHCFILRYPFMKTLIFCPWDTIKEKLRDIQQEQSNYAFETSVEYLVMWRKYKIAETNMTGQN